MKSLLFSGCLLALSSCVSATIASAPGVSAPVMLSETDRIGGGAPMVTSPQGAVDVQVERSMIAVANRHYSSTVVSFSSKLKMTEEFTDRTKDLPGAQIKITEAGAGGLATSFLMSLFGLTMHEGWVHVKGTVVRVEGVAK